MIQVAGGDRKGECHADPVLTEVGQGHRALRPHHSRVGTFGLCLLLHWDEVPLKTSYVILEVQCKMSMWGHLFKMDFKNGMGHAMGSRADF